MALILCGRWAPPMIRRARLLQAQRQCMQYQAIPNQPVFVASAVGAPQVSPTQVSPRPIVSITHVAAPWADFYGILSPPGMRSEGTAFLHERIDRAGHRRLVAVDIHLMTVSPPESSIQFVTRVLKPGTLASDPEPLSDNLQEIILEIHATMEVVGGVVDPNDPSHFTFQIHDGPFHRRIDGWLGEDDRVVLELHDVPTSTAPAASSP